MSENERRRVATYERVSSEDQRERETIKTQSEAIARHLQLTEGVELIDRYIDDGVSGTIPMSRRLSGRRLLEDSARRRFDEVWIYNVKRLGRDDVDPLLVWRDLEALGVKIYSVTEGISDLFNYHIHVAFAAKDRRDFLALSAEGQARVARDGRPMGGTPLFGYRVVGAKAKARWEFDDTPIWLGKSPADIMQWILRTGRGTALELPPDRH